MKSPKIRVPQNVMEILEVLSSMLVTAPKFLDKTGYFPDHNIDSAFQQLNQGLSFNRPTLGEDRYHRLIAMSDQMRALYEADPENTNGETRKGRDMIYEMEDILNQVRRKT